MVICPKLFLGAALLVITAASTSAQTRPAGDQDDQFVITGCVVRAADIRDTGPQSLMVWSRGDVYLASPSTRLKPSETARPTGTAGVAGTTFYWLDDEDDFAKYAGRQVEIVGELSDEIDRGEIEMTREGDFTEVVFDAGNREATAKIPTAWFGPAVRGKDIDAEVSFRRVDVERVNPVGSCSAR